MATKTRKAATGHNPTNFEPRDYEVWDYLDNHRPQYWLGMPVEAYREEVKAWEADMERALGPDWRKLSHRCVHCGNGSIRWISVVYHFPTKTKVVFGSDCTRRLGFTDKHAFKLAQIQARAEARKVRFTIYAKRAEFLTAHPELKAMSDELADPVHAKNTFAHDVFSKLDKYGDLSDKQVASVVASMKRDHEFAARKAAEAAEVKGDAPSGRCEVSGVVLSVQERETGFGFSLKMLVKLDNNSKVWVTAPRKEDIARGDRLTVRATWEVSNTDRSFAFGARPYIVKHEKPAQPADVSTQPVSA